jgi:uncharacterized protein (TIGR03437 family)
VVGFGSSDVTITHVWVVSPGLLQMNVSVNASANAAPVMLTVASGLQLATLTASLQIAAANPSQISLRTPILNQATGLAGVPVGGTAIINTSNLPFNATAGTLAGWNLTIANQPAQFALADHGQLIVQVPGGLLTGPSVVQLLPANGAPVPPVLMQVDPLPPVITAVADIAQGVAAGVFHAGDSISITVTGLGDALGNFPAASQMDVNVGGIDMVPASLTPVNDLAQSCKIVVSIPATLATGAQPMYIRYTTRESATFPITLQ